MIHDYSPLEGDTIPGRASLLAGKFVLLRKLGEGAMGEVWEADQPEMERKVAIKLIRPGLALQEEQQRRFLNEARAAGKLSHPNIVTLHDFGRADGQLYIAMEYLTGENLYALMQRQPRQPPRRAMSIWMPLARAMAHAHRKGVVHRDLKPENIFLAQPVTGGDGEPQVKVLDFGIAKLHGGRKDERETAVGTTMGSPLYMAPEQFGRAETADAKADVFALGVILFELLAGQRPYPAYSIGLAGHGPPSLQKLAPEVPAALETLIGRMLALDPKARPTIDVVLAAIPPHLVRGPGGPERRWLLPAVISGAILIGITGLYLRLRPSQADPPRPRGPREQAQQVLKAALADREKEKLRIEAAAAIGAGRDPDLHVLLAPLLKDPVDELRAVAAVGLGRLRAKQDAEDILRVAQQDRNASTRVAAAEALGDLHRSEAREVLYRVLDVGQPDKDAQLRAAELLAKAGEIDGRLDGKTTVRSWLEAHRSVQDPEWRRRILVRLALSPGGKYSVEEAREDLARLMEAGSEEVKLATANSLARLDDTRGLKELGRIASGVQPQRLSAALRLAERQDSSVCSIFAAALSGKLSEAERLDAAAGLSICGKKEGMDGLTGLLGSSDPLVRVRVAGMVLRLTAVGGDLKQAETDAKDTSWELRRDAILVLGDADDDRSFVLVSDALKDNRREVKLVAVEALGRQQARARRALKVLFSRLDENQDTEVRQQMIEAIGRVRGYLHRNDSEGQSAQEKLRALSQGQNPIDALVASAALWRLGDRRGRDVLQRDLGSRDVRLRRLVLELGEADEDMLREALVARDGEVRFGAARLLAKRSGLSGQERGAVEKVLRERLGNGRVDGLLAYGLLCKLNVPATGPRLGEMLNLLAGDRAGRLATVKALGELPVKEALPILHAALQNSDVEVRRKAADVAFALAGGSDGEGRQMLKALENDLDADPAVRSRAAALLRLPVGGKPGPTGEEPLKQVKVPGPTPEELLGQAKGMLGRGADARKVLDLLQRAEKQAHGNGALLVDVYWTRAEAYKKFGPSDGVQTEYEKILNLSGGGQAKENAVGKLKKGYSIVIVSEMDKGVCKKRRWLQHPNQPHVYDLGNGQRQQVNPLQAGQEQQVGSCAAKKK